MDLYSPIFTRKSTRKFDTTPLGAQKIKEVEAFIDRLQPLLPQSKLTYKIVDPDEVKGIAVPKAPHFILISGKEQPLRNTCAGFLFQHVELYLYSLGYATRWLNSVKGKQSDSSFIITIAFGKPEEPATRKLSEFDRKPVSEIVKGIDSRFDAVRLAPSGMNGQPWYFIADGAAVHVYYKESLGGMKGMLYHLTDLDVGIALCHLAVASEHEGKPFQFNTDGKKPPTPPKGFTYVGTVL